MALLLVDSVVQYLLLIFFAGHHLILEFLWTLTRHVNHVDLGGSTSVSLYREILGPNFFLKNFEGGPSILKSSNH